MRWCYRWIERIEPLGRKVPDTGRKPIAKNGTCGKNVIGEASCVSELLADMVASIIQEQAVQDIGCFARCRWDGNPPGN